MSAKSKFINHVLLGIFLIFYSSNVFALTLLDLPQAYKSATLQFFPIPYFETDPSAGQRYGLMPTFLLLDPEKNVITIAVGAVTYNPKVVGWGGFAGLFFYPSPKEFGEIFVLTGQNFERDYYLNYSNDSWMNERLSVEGELEYSQNPFERFFGFGPNSNKNNGSNFVSHVWFWRGKVAYEFWPHLDLKLEEEWKRMIIYPRALLDLNDTATFFFGNREVSNQNQWIHKLGLAWDTLDNAQFPSSGDFLEAYGIMAHDTFFANRVYTGYEFSAKKIITLRDRFTTVAFVHMKHLFGDEIPFYLQPSLGGENELRGFIGRRFVGRGKLFAVIEERILAKRWNIMDTKFDLSIDPFVSVGQVFDRVGEISAENMQPVGGIGFRALVKPSVVGRVDVAVSGEGVEIFTTLNYPF